MDNIKSHLYSARWAISKALDGDMSKLDYAADEIVKAKALDIIGDDDEPERPDTSDEDVVNRDKYEIPNIVKVPGIKFKKRGKYKTPSNLAKGLVVHYTVSGDSPSSAKGVMNYMAKKGLGCMVMDEFGTIYVPDNFDLDEDVAYHAGKSSWKGATGISRYCMGMEICNWGRLDKTTRKRADSIRLAIKKDNIQPGEYEEYKPAQEKALINFILWQLDTNKEFKLDWVIGHDECAPKRKADPGGSLSMSMPGLRDHIAGIIKTWQ